jgi:hypothetical protein
MTTQPWLLAFGLDKMRSTLHQRQWTEPSRSTDSSCIQLYAFPYHSSIAFINNKIILDFFFSVYLGILNQNHSNLLFSYIEFYSIDKNHCEGMIRILLRFDTRAKRE